MVDSARALVTPDAGPVRRWFTLLAVGLTAAISMSEINRLIATAVIDPSRYSADAGKRAGIDSVLAPSAFTHRDAWDVWSHTAYSDAIAVWIACHVLLDVVLVVCMFLWLRKVFDTGSPGTAGVALGCRDRVRRGHHVPDRCGAARCGPTRPDTGDRRDRHDREMDCLPASRDSREPKR